LSINDIAAVRKNDERLSSWRLALRSVMQACYGDYSERKIDDREFRRLAHEEIAEGRARVADSIKKLQHLDLLKTAVKSVGVGVVVTAVSTPSNIFIEGASMGAATAGFTFLYDYVDGKIG